MKQFYLLKGILTVLVIVICSITYGQATFTARQNGNWNASSTWDRSSGSDVDGIPDADDHVIIGNYSVTVSANAAAVSITLRNGSSININSDVTLNVNGVIELENLLNANTNSTLSGNGTINALSLNIITIDGNGSNGPFTATINSTVQQLNISGNLTVNSNRGNNDLRLRNGVFNLSEGTVKVTGRLITINENSLNTSTITLDLGAQAGTLILENASPVSLSTSGNNNLEFNGTNATVVYGGAGNQAIHTTTYKNLQTSGSGTKALSNTFTVSGNLTVNSGTALGVNSHNINVAGSVFLEGNINFTTGYLVLTGNTNQQLNSTNPAFTITNLRIQKDAGNAILGTGNNQLIITGSLDLAKGVLDVSGKTLTFQNGDAPITRLNNGTGTLTTSTTTNLIFGTAGNTGGAAATIPTGTFTAVPVVNNFTINRSNALTLGSQDLTVNGTLTLTAGILSAGSNTVILGTAATFSGGSTLSHVQGNLRRLIATGTHTSLNFPIGDGSVYAPVSLALTGTVTAATGSITIRTTAGEHPDLGASGINNTRSVNRYWTIEQTSPVPGMVSYAPTFNYASGDNDAGTTASAYTLRLFNNSNWFPVTVSGTPTSAQILGTGIQQFGEFAVGQITGTISVATHPVSQSVCEGAAVSFSASSTSVPVPTIQWQRDNGSGYEPVTANSDPGVVYSGFTSGTLTITGANASINSYSYRAVFSNINGVVNSDPATLTVNQVLTPVVTLTNSIASDLTFYSISICAGTPVTFTANARNTGGGTVTYNFKVNGTTVQNGPAATFTSSSFQNNDLVSCDISVSSGACLTTTTASTTTTVTSTYIAVTTPAVTVAASTGSTICSGTEVDFTATASNTGGGNITYEFRKNGVPVQTINSNLSTATYTTSSLAGGDVITCAISLNGGTCSGATATSSPLTMTVVTSVTPAVNLVQAPATSVCAGTPVTFTATAGNTGGGTVSFNFQVNGTTRQSGASNTFTVSNLSNGQVVTCEIIVTGGICTAAGATSNAITASVVPQPTVSLSASPAGAVCSGTPVTFTATAGSAGGAAINYIFSVNGTEVQAGTAASFTSASLVQGDQVQCRIELTSGTCSGATASSNIVTMNVVAGFTPAVTLSVAPGISINAGGTATFTAVASNTNGGSITYTFKVNGAITQSGSSNVFSTSILQNGQVVSCEISITGGGCLTSGTAVSNSIEMTVIGSGPLSLYVWSGAVSTDWNTADNWSLHEVPPAGSNILIQAGSARYPVLTSGTTAVGALTIEAGGSLTVNASALLQLAGALQNSGILNATQGAVEFNGSSLQTINGSLFSNSTVKDLVISNNVSLSGPMQLTGTLSFGNVNNKTLASNGHLVLKSDVNGTARVADLTNSNVNTGNTITGHVTVEQYIPSARKWRGLSAPLKGSSLNSIFDNWQNGGVERAGRGMLLWSPNGTGVDGNGFSLNSAPGAATNILGGGNSAFTTPASTKTTPLFDENGPRPYVVFLTDQYHSANNSGRMLPSSGSAATTLAAKGELITGVYTQGSLGSGYRMIANPYASAVDFATIGKTNINNQFWIWDPKLTGTYGVGGYVYTSNSGSGYVSAPLTGSYTNTSTMIPAGGAFWVQVNDGFIGSLTFRETDKGGSAPMLFGSNQAGENQILRANLKDAGASVTYDGVAAVYNNTSTKELDAAEAQKFSIGTENISIRRFNRNWAIEFRPVVNAADTVFLRLHNMKQQSYNLELQGENFELTGYTAVLQDLFLNTETPVNLFGTQRITFTVTSAAASTGDRFRIVFRPNVITSVGPDVNGAQGVQIYPNPVVRGGETQVQFRNLKAGRYQFSLYAVNGARVQHEVLNHSGGSAVQKVRIAVGLNTGVYYAEIMNEKGWSERVKLIVE